MTQSVCDLALRFGEGADEEEATMVRLPLQPRPASHRLCTVLTMCCSRVRLVWRS